MPVIMGTAGHIDHGKTTLIKALSGIDCDRLKDEKKRGITIELGFAFLDLPDGQRLGIVDVPGHEKFVKNMVAGAAGIDFVLLTVAADEGIMPQTQEHLEICSLLGIRKGIVALTKTDTVDQDLLELAQEELEDFLSTTFLAEAPIFPVSAHTGHGIEELKKALQEEAAGLEARSDTDLFRLPVDRVFTMRGHGTVVTGTLVSGKISLGEPVLIYPEETKSKIRGVQVHGQSVESVSAGRRTALNLAGLEVEDLQRGDVLARPNTLLPSYVWDVELTCLSSSPRSLKHRKELHFHHGTREVLARIYLLDAEEVAPGETVVAQVRFPSPMVGAYGDRFVIRSFSPLRTVGGGKLLNPLGRKVKRFSKQVDQVRALSEEDPHSLVLTQLEMAGPTGLTEPTLRVMTNQSSKRLHKLLQDMSAKQEIFLFDREEQRYVLGQLLQDLIEDLLDYIARHHRNHPMETGISRSRITSEWGRELPPKLVHFLLEQCLKKQRLVTDQDVLRLPEHTISLARDQSELKEDLIKAYERGGITPPNLNGVLEELQVSQKEALPVLRLLTDEGKLVKVKDGLYFSTQALERIKKMVLDYFAEHEDLTPGDFKNLTGLTRKYSIPLLEQLDKEKLTMRVGDTRKLRKK